MQAGARGVMHQHPLRLRQRLQAGEYRIGALSAAIHHGNLRMLRQRQLAEAAIAGADGNHHPLDARIRQLARRPRVRESFCYRLRDIVSHSVCMRRPKPAAGTTAQTPGKVAAML